MTNYLRAVNYLYKHWSQMGLLIALYVGLMLFSFKSQISLIVLLIWLQFVIYLIHEFEEHAYPGGFKNYINRQIFGSKVNDLPLNDAIVFWINILGVWILFPLGAYLATNVDLKFGMLLPIFGIFNASLHIIMALKKRQYNPGLLVSIFLNYPSGIYTIYYARKLCLLTTGTVTGCLATTIIVHLMIIGVAVKRSRLINSSASRDNLS
jgi:hypothetical protein